jgi:putative transposase
MKRSRFSEEQIIAILKEADGGPVKLVCARHNISQATNYQRTAFLQEVQITYFHKLGHGLGWDE